MVAPMVIAAGISAAGSLLGGLFGGKEKTETTVDYRKMVREAEAAGFNPLTAIRNGGSAGFQTTHHPALSAGSFMQSAANGIANVVEALDPMKQATADLEFKIRQETLANLQADTAARRRASIGGVPVSTGAQAVRATSGLATNPTAPLPQERPKSVTNPGPIGSGWESNPWFPDAEWWETRLGDLGGSLVGGPLNILADIGWNVNKKAKANEKAGNRIQDWKPKTLTPNPNLGAQWRPPSLPANRGW